MSEKPTKPDLKKAILDAFKLKKFLDSLPLSERKKFVCDSDYFFTGGKEEKI